MAPISYQGPLADEEDNLHTHSQTAELNLGVGQPGLTVEAILADKGDSIYTVSPQTTVMEVVAELARLKVGALVVTGGGNEPVGIVSERDIVRNVESKGVGVFESAVQEIMTPNPQTCTPADKVEAVMKQMTDGRFRHLPVLKNGQLCGLVSIGDIVRHRMLEMEYENLKMKQAIVG